MTGDTIIQTGTVFETLLFLWFQEDRLHAAQRLGRDQVAMHLVE